MIVLIVYLECEVIVAGQLFKRLEAEGEEVSQGMKPLWKLKTSRMQDLLYSKVSRRTSMGY